MVSIKIYSDAIRLGENFKEKRLQNNFSKFDQKILEKRINGAWAEITI